MDAGHEVRILAHPSEDLADALPAVGVRVEDLDVLTGDIRDAQVVEQALLRWCDAVLHAAGIVGVDDRRVQLMWEVNVDATAHLLSRAAVAGLDPIVHVASYSALFPPPDGVIGPTAPRWAALRTGARSRPQIGWHVPCRQRVRRW